MRLTMFQFSEIWDYAENRFSPLKTVTQTERLSTGNRHWQDSCGDGALLIPLLLPQGQSRSTCKGDAQGQWESLYLSSVSHDHCAPNKSSSLCPCAQWKAFHVASTVNFISVAGLLVPLPTQNKQPDSRQLIGGTARSRACQRPVACKQLPPKPHQSASIHCREDFWCPRLIPETRQHSYTSLSVRERWKTGDKEKRWGWEALCWHR